MQKAERDSIRRVYRMWLAVRKFQLVVCMYLVKSWDGNVSKIQVSDRIWRLRLHRYRKTFFWSIFELSVFLGPSVSVLRNSKKLASIWKTIFFLWNFWPNVTDISNFFYTWPTLQCNISFCHHRHMNFVLFLSLSLFNKKNCTHFFCIFFLGKYFFFVLFKENSIANTTTFI